MYVPAHFAAPDPAVEDFLAGMGAADLAGQLRAIVGVELRITRIAAKSKLSQNRPAADIAGVIAGLTADGHEDHARAVLRESPEFKA